ncbi:hypothetical protein DRE_00949 [Drechslerella stenobrocha 248]|uniref:Uncharacterized protein n=1 Tax=Drechslerella stenobrocha 248 TaxID=1043628 RepID=W7I7D7_9PEZI|nr:hypothetical protein DRE_00949 [Drechslerella stenobrocha 248]
MDGSLEVNEGLAMSGAPSSTSSTPSPPTPEIPRSIPHSLGIIPREPTIFLSPGSGGGISEPHHIPQAAFQPRIKPLTYTVPTEEPPVATVLTCNEQKKYLFLLRHICVKAAHAFYSDHNLRAALDKKHIPIFLTKDKQIARLPFDLTLPQWTQHLRKACDTRFITADIVQCIESFKGEIQPVDEVHHALVKGKTKSDRALLAVIEAARTFVKQLKDWEMCEMVDSVYNEVELLILLKKRAMAADIGEGGGDASRNTRRRTWN